MKKNIVQKTEIPGLTLNTKLHKSFFENNDISKYDKKNVIYIGTIGYYMHEFLLKFGKTSDVIKRTGSEHKYTFGDQFKVLFVIETDNKDKVEKIFEKYIASKELDVVLNFKGKPRTELFVTSNMFQIEDSILLLKKIIEENQLDSIKEKDAIIEKLEYKVENNLSLLIEKEKTKQAQLAFKLKKIETKFIKHEQKNNNMDNINNININNISDIDDKINNDNIFLKFWNENIQKTSDKSDKIHCVDLLICYKKWIQNNKIYVEILNNKIFTNILRKHENNIGKVEAIRIENKSNLGLRKIKFCTK
jgi:translation elongation factor EF-1beta